jgi:hypothetical protein
MVRLYGIHYDRASFIYQEYFYMPRKILTIASSLCAMLALPAFANQLYLDGSIGNAEAEVGSLDADDTFLRLGAGVTLTEQLSAEGGYWDFGSSRAGGVRVAADALFAAIKASTPIGNDLNLYGRLGLMRWDADVGRRDDDGFDLLFGGGIDFQAGPGRVGVEIHFADMDELDIRTLGLSYRLPIEF